MNRPWMYIIGLLILALCVPLAAWEDLNINAQLRRPGVKLVVVEFYAEWCKPCKAAVPKWRRLHEKYRDQGLRLIVISVGSAGVCANPGWQPDQIVCDVEGTLQEQWGASSLPQAFLYSWQGTLLASHAEFETVETAVKRFYKESPRILVANPTDQDGQILGNGKAIRDMVRNEMQRQAKFDMVAGPDEQKQLDALRGEAQKAKYNDTGKCRLGAAVSANSELKVKLVSWKDGSQTLVLQLFSLEKGCMLASGKARISDKGIEFAVYEAVHVLVESLIGPSPGMATAIPAANKVEPAQDDLDAIMKKAEMAKAQKAQQESDWNKVRTLSEEPIVPKEDRVAAVAAFLKKYPDNNPFQGKAEQLIKDIKADRVGKAGMRWAYVKGGTFKMGAAKLDEDQRPVHKVTISPFFISVTEVTVAQYRACVQAKACTEPLKSDRNSRWQVYCNYDKQGYDNHPVNCVNWHQAQQFATWAGGQLPTEAQWEFAATDGGQRYYPWGIDTVSCETAVINDEKQGCGRNDVWPVCSHAKGNSAQGVCDLIGNVSEWTADWYDAQYYQRSTKQNPTGPSDGTEKSVRGGSWYGKPEANISTKREMQVPGFKNGMIGIRVVRNAPTAKTQ